jgi:ATP-dependent Clp protease ATP-binding subunit ClpC
MNPPPESMNPPPQIMEDGRLTDSKGRHVDFKNTLIVMTSNVGSQMIASGAHHMGFQLRAGEKDVEEQGRVEDLVKEELKRSVIYK